MSKASSSPAPVSSSKASSSAWAKGPPTQSSSPLPTSPALSTPRSGAGTPNGQHVAAVAPPAAAGGQSRKPSIMAIGGEAQTVKSVDILGRGNPQPINFGSLDSPNAALSSSPAAPSVAGAHLDANAVKSFGTIEADASAAAQRANTDAAVQSGGKKPLDMHALFGANNSGSSIVPDAAASQEPRSAGPAPSFQMPISGQHLRPPPPGPQPRSPTLGTQMPQVQSFRPMNLPSNRINGQPGHGMPNARGPGLPGQAQGQYGVHPGQTQQYPGMGGYPSQSGYYYNMYEHQNQYGVSQQWAGQQGPGHSTHGGQSSYPQMAMSPRGSQQPLGHGSPSPHNAVLPSSGVPSPSPTPPSRPQSMAGQTHSASPMATAASPAAPTTPSRPLPFQAPASPYTPHVHPSHLQGQVPQSPASLAALSASASSFTPRRPASAIKISRPDGTTLDLEAAARAVRPTTPASGNGSPAAVEPKPEGKKPGFMPVVVRLESEEQKKIRLAEEAREKKMKELEQQEEQDRKERKARQEADRVQAQADAEKAANERAAQAAAEAEKARIETEAKAKADAQAKAEAEADEAAAKDAAEAKARAEAEEARRAAVTESASSIAQAPPASNPTAPAEGDAGVREASLSSQDAPTTATPSTPAPSTSGLPTKPASPSDLPASTQETKKSAPSALNLASTSSDSDAPPSASVAALGSARNIEDLQAISYPSNLKSPATGLNETSEPGKFRYDRDFLLQFMEICREKPESLPALEAIGLEADTSSNFGSGRGGARGGRGMGPPGAGRGGGIGGGRGGFPNMGNFQMGAFGSGQMGRPSTSEERLAQSRMPPGNARMGGGQMHRSLSQGGPSQLPHMNSRGGQNRSQRGTKRLPNDNRMSYNPAEPEVAPLVTTGDAWSGQRRRAVDENSPEFIERKVKALLNKLTQEKFDSISVQILEWADKSKDETDGRTLRLVIKLIFEKATDEAHWSSMYARLCRMLLDRLSDEVSDTIDGKRISGGPLFRKYLLGRCQVDFEAGWKSREDAASAALATSEDDKARLAAKAAAGEKAEEEEEDQPQEAAMLSDEYYAAQKAKRRGLGLVQLIGELFKMEMLTKSVIVTCMVKLLSNVNDPDEEDIESTCKLLTTVGAVMERQHSSALDVFFDRLKDLSKSPNINSRMRFMVLDVMELRANKWQLRNSDGGVQTIAQVHEQAAREQAKKSAQAAQSSREASSRSGSRQGHPRRNDFGGQGGSDWTPVANARLPQRQTDFSSFGRIGTQTGVPTALGPSSVFNKRKSAVPGQVTPPLSRQSSSSNMFGVLSGDGSVDAGPSDDRRGSGDASSQRKKLALLPRSKPVDGEDDDEKDAEGDEDEDDADDGAESDDAGDEGEDADALEMTESQARTKIATDVKELWGEKDAGGSRNPEDILEYFRALPAAYHKLLASQLVDDVFRIAKKSDAEVVAKGWTKALDTAVTTSETLQSSLLSRMETLDDDSIDFPLAYAAVAILMRGAKLSEEAIGSLGDAIAVDGTPRITPKDKLQRAFANLDSA